MLKKLIENKRELVREHPAQLKSERNDLLEEAGRESNSAGLEQLLARIAEIDLSLSRQALLGQVATEVEQKRRALSAAEQKAKLAEQKVFVNHCEEIASGVIARAFYPPNSLRISTNDRLLFDLRVSRYCQQLATVLSKQDALKQVSEINHAYHEKRDWKAVVKLPQPDLSIEQLKVGITF